jgi:hypothetical protein
VSLFSLCSWASCCNGCHWNLKVICPKLFAPIGAKSTPHASGERLAGPTLRQYGRMRTELWGDLPFPPFCSLSALSIFHFGATATFCPARIDPCLLHCQRFSTEPVSPPPPSQGVQGRDHWRRLPCRDKPRWRSGTWQNRDLTSLPQLAAAAPLTFCHSLSFPQTYPLRPPPP